MIFKDNFIKIMRSEIDMRYALGGGQMNKWKEFYNFDQDGNPVGFDCCGGIMWAMKQATEINLILRNVPGMMTAPWVYEIKEKKLKKSDLIFVDVPGKDENGDIKRDENGYPVYGVYNHVMTFIDDYDYDIITTKGVGGDFRVNPKSKTITDYWNLEKFKEVSARIFENTTLYTFMRIDWKWLEDWKKQH